MESAEKNKRNIQKMEEEESEDEEEGEKVEETVKKRQYKTIFINLTHSSNAHFFIMEKIISV